MAIKQLGDSWRLRALVENDIVTSSNVLNAASPGVSIQLPSDGLWRISGVIIYRTAATGTGIALGMLAPSNAGFSVSVGIFIAADAAAACFNGQINNSKSSVVSPSVQTANTDQHAEFWGVLNALTTGALQFAFASEVNASAVTVRPGSYIMAESL